jgi:long-chain acyl-CoA synthetase
MTQGARQLGELVGERGEGGAPAVIDTGSDRTLTYAELATACSRVAGGLRAAGLAVGERIGILSRNRAELLCVLFGALRAGCVPVPLNTRLPDETLGFIARDAELRLLFTDAEQRDRAPAGLATVDFDASGAGGYERFVDVPPLPPVELADDAEAVLLYTSGSSGRPKGVVQSHASQLWMVRALLPPPEFIAPDQRILVAAPLYHKNGLLSSKLALGMGGAIVLLPRFEAKSYIEAIGAHRCSSIGGVPTMFALLARERELLAKTDLSSVKRITIGSAPLTGALLEEVQDIFPNALIVNGYGTTESGAAAFGMHPAGKRTPPLSLGYPLAAVELRLVGSDGDERDSDGELWIRSQGVMRGYLNLADATASKLENGWYKTGDLMRRDADGFYFFVGRVDDMFNCGGENVYPGEVESLLERHPHVHQAVVVPVDDHVKGSLPTAFVVPKAGATLLPEELKQFALEHGPAYQHPRRVWVVDALPLAGTNKIDRRALVERAALLAQSPEGGTST